MQATIESREFHSALIRECEIDLQARMTMLLEVARVYCHAFLCPNCRPYCPRIAGVLADVARQVGAMIQGWEIIEVDIEDVLDRRPKETALLLRLCRASVNVGADETAEIEWRTALGLTALAVAMESQRTSRIVDKAAFVRGQ